MSFYEGLEKHELPLHLTAIDSELEDIEAKKAELDQEAEILNEHRVEILRLMGIIVLEDYRGSKDA